MGEGERWVRRGKDVGKERGWRRWVMEEGVVEMGEEGR